MIIMPLDMYNKNHNVSPNILFQTLPFPIQTTILSLLTIESHRFCPRNLHSLASHILNSDLPLSSDHPAFWARRAARNLFDVLPEKVLQSEQLLKEDEFDSLPQWLEDAAKKGTPCLPWLPANASLFQKAASFEPGRKTGSKEVVKMDRKIEPLLELEASNASLPPLHPRFFEKAAALKAELLDTDSTADLMRLAEKIRQLCLECGGGNELKLLEMIQPWEANDETLSALLLLLVNDNGLVTKSWPSYVLCSMAFPKLLTLRNPASQDVLSATILFCKQHQTAAVEALIFPLVLRKEGIIKVCLHPSHVSAFCQRLLCGVENGRRNVLLPCHLGLISEQMVWTDSTFNLFKNIMNLEIYFTPDTNDQLVSVIVEMASKFSKSLKFGNFLLCFVTKYSFAVNAYKAQLRDAAEKTSTLVTRSILSSLNA